MTGPKTSLKNSGYGATVTVTLHGFAEVQAADLDPGAELALLADLVDAVRRGEVLDGDAERLEQGDLVRRGASRGLAGQHLADLADDVVVAEAGPRPWG